MGYINQDGRVRVDVFKSSGKWYTTCSVDMEGYYAAPLLHKALFDACSREQATGSGWDLTTSPEQWLQDGGMIVCSEPYHKHSHPIMLTRVNLPSFGIALEM